MKSMRVFPDSEELAEEIARSWCEQARNAANNCGTFSVVLSGGNQDPTLYGRLTEPKWRDCITWESVHIFFADERCVPPDDNESNYKTICGHLLNHVPIPEKNIHRMQGEGDPVEESFRYAEEIQNYLMLRKEKDYFFDWVFMGLGADGHTASLFPGQKKLFESPNLCEVSCHPETYQKRITLTPSAIQRSACITYHVIGKQKAEAVSALILKSTKSKNYPAVLIPGEWYLDQAAASGLSPS